MAGLGGALLGGVTGGVVGGAIVRLMLDDKQFQAGLAKSQGQLNATAGSAKATGASIMKGLALPMAAAAGLSIKAAIDFESAFAGVRKTVDATEAEFAVLEQGIRDMAMEVPTAANEIAGVAEAAGQLGIAQEDILGFTRVMIDLGVATDLTARDAAMQLARMANIMQTPTAEFENMGSTIVHLGNNLAATESEIVKFATRIAGAGQVAGLAEADVLSLAGALTDVGVPAERGGTAVQKMLLAMNDAVATGNENLATFAETAGMTADEFAAAWRDDAAMALITFVEGLGRAGDNATTVLRELGLGNERTIASFLSLAGAGDKAREALELGRAGWTENIALTEEAEKRYETMASQITILLNRVVDLGITLGQALAPAVRVVVDLFGSLVDILGPVLGGIGKVLSVFADFMAVLSGIHPLLPPLAVMFAVLGTRMLFAAAAGVAFSGSMTKVGFSVASAQASSALAVSGMTGLGTAMIRSIPIAGALAAGFLALGNAVSNLTGAHGSVEEAAEAFKGRLVDALKAGEASVEQVIAAIKKWNASGFGDQVRVDAEEVLTLAGIITQAKGAADGAGPAMEELAGEIGDVGEEAEEAYKNARELYNAMLQLAGGFLGVAGAAFSLEDAQGDLAAAQQKVNKLADRGKQGTKAWAEATRDLERAELAVIESKLGLTSSVQDFVNEQREAGVATGQIIKQIRQQGRDAGLTRDQVSGLVGMVRDLIKESRGVPTPIRQQYQSNVNEQLSQVQSLSSALSALDGRLIRYNIVGSGGGHAQRIGHTGGLVTPGGVAHGGGLLGGAGNIPLLAQSGEFIMSRRAVASIGAGNLAAMNAGKMGAGSIHVHFHNSVISDERTKAALGRQVASSVREALREQQSRSSQPLLGMPV